MIRALTPLAILATLGIAGCVADATQDEAVTIYDDNPVGKVVGVVTDLDGVPLADVEITLSNGGQGFTDDMGAYEIESVEPAEMLVVTYELPGFNTAYNDISLTGWETQTANSQLRPVGSTHYFHSSDGGTFVDGTGSYTFQPNSIVDEWGNAYDGEVVLSLTTVDVSKDRAEPGPGDFTGIRTDGREGLLVSYGFFEASLHTPDGEDLNIDSSLPVGFEMEVPQDIAETDENLPTGSVPMWWFDGDTARWVEEGEASIATRDDGTEVFVADIPHFTWWNVDWWYEDLLVCIKGQVTDIAGNPLPGAEVAATGIDWRRGSPYTVSAVADENGFFELGEMFENQVVDVTVWTVLDGEVWTTTVEYTTNESITTWGTVCEAVTDPFVIDVCAMGGEVNLVHRSAEDPGGSYSEIDGTVFSSGASETLAGTAQFYDATGSATCDYSWQGVEHGTCVMVDDLTDMPWNMDAHASARDRGTPLKLQSHDNSSHTVDYNIDDNNRYAAAVDNSEDFGVGESYQYLVPGNQADTYPGYIQAQALYLPQAIEGPETYYTFDRDESTAIEVTAGTDAAYSDKGVWVVVSPDASAGGLVCHGNDDGSIEIPAESLQELEGGAATVHVFRAETRFHSMPEGYANRSLGATVYSVSAYIR